MEESESIESSHSILFEKEQVRVAHTVSCFALQKCPDCVAVQMPALVQTHSSGFGPTALQTWQHNQQSRPWSLPVGPTLLISSRQAESPVAMSTCSPTPAHRLLENQGDTPCHPLPPCMPMATRRRRTGARLWKGCGSGRCGRGVAAAWAAGLTQPAHPDLRESMAQEHCLMILWQTLGRGLCWQSCRKCGPRWGAVKM